MSALAAQIRALQITHTIFLVSVGVYACLGEFLGPKVREVPPVLQMGFAVCAALSVAAALIARRSMTMSALEVLRADPDNSQALQRWRGGQLASMVLFVSVALCGFALRFLGVALVRVIPFYLASALLLIWFRPSEPAS